MHPTLVILVVGPDAGAARPAHAQPAAASRAQGGLRPLQTVMPAVTCTVQSTLVTGLPPRGHGCVANGWYFRDLAEVMAVAAVEPPGRRREDLGGRQAARSGLHLRQDVLVVQHVRQRPTGAPRRGRCIRPTAARSRTTTPIRPSCTTSSTPGSAPSRCSSSGARPPTSHPAPGSRARPLHVRETRKPTLTLCYLPHLDYNLQRLGPDPAHPRMRKDLQEVDALVRRADRAGRARRRTHHRGRRNTASRRWSMRCTSTARCARPG